MRTSINPFRYGGVVGDDAFCNRKQELADLRRAFENGERLFLYSERRLGKTSLVKRALGQLPKRGYLAAYVDLWPTDDPASFATTMARALTTGLAGSADKMLESAKRFFGSLVPTLSVGADGKPELSFAGRSRDLRLPELREILTAPAAIAKRRKCRVVVALDEFQRVLDYDGDLVERTLRSVVQEQPAVSYVFLGSKKHLIQRMFLDQERPLYRAGAHYPLGPIAVQHWLPFIRDRFARSTKSIDDSTIRAICETAAGHPFYVQHLSHSVWELCPPGEAVAPGVLDTALDLLLERESYAYSALWESLTLNQRRFLMGLAHEPGAKIHSADFVRAHGLRSSSSVQRSVRALLERDVIDRDNGSFVIADRFLAIWIRREGAPA